MPTSLNLATYATNSILNVTYQELYDITGTITTSNSINLTKNDGSYNYAEFRTDGITNFWDFKRNSTRITAEYLSQTDPTPTGSIPFGQEYLIFAGITILGLIIIIRKNLMHVKN